jgi:hypothetical protein
MTRSVFTCVRSAPELSSSGECDGRRGRSGPSVLVPSPQPSGARRRPARWVPVTGHVPNGGNSFHTQTTSSYRADLHIPRQRIEMTCCFGSSAAAGAHGERAQVQTAHRAAQSTHTACSRRILSSRLQTLNQSLSCSPGRRTDLRRGSPCTRRFHVLCAQVIRADSDIRKKKLDTSQTPSHMHSNSNRGKEAIED